MQIIGSNSIGTGVRFTLGANDDLLVAPGVTVGSTDLVAIFAGSGGHHANIQGTVSGEIAGIQLGNDPTAQADNHLHVGDNGYVAGSQYAVFVQSHASVIENYGTIWSALNALQLFGNSLVTHSTVENSGFIEGEQSAINRSGTGAFVLVNSGLIKSAGAAYVTSGTAIDQITNTGRMVGAIIFAGGDDVYDGATGRLTGEVLAGDGDDTLIGGVDADSFYGGANNDVLRGNGGDDRLDGGLGIDQLFGGAGNDIYFVDNPGDIVNEAVGNGIDIVVSQVSFNLANTSRAVGAVENLFLDGLAANGTGNALANQITGNSSVNILDGAGGNDTLIGQDGNDTLIGGLGNDKLNGGLGNDKLIGGANSDIFIFNTAPNAASNRDVITDFSHVYDTFQLENAIFTKLGAGVHALNPAFFRVGAAAADANDYIVYNKATGALFYDDNGSGAGHAVMFAVLANKPVLAANDFVVI